jgi:hypothetical protein
MKIENIDIEATIEKARRLVAEDKNLSAASRSMFEIMILIITLLANRLNLNSTKSSKPPSSDPNRKKKPKSKTGKKPGGQKGHVGTTLKKVDDPDKIKVIKVDRRKLPAGQYRQVGFESRQVFDIDICRVVTEYQAQILEDANGKQFVASFPEGVKKDETGMNIDGKGHWLHCVSNGDWTFYYPHQKRGLDAINDMDILPKFKGILCHGHWKPYYKIGCTHALCNAHHLRELTRAFEQDAQNWAQDLSNLLVTINNKVIDAGGALNAANAQKYRSKYRQIIKKGEIECPEPVRPKKKGKRGRIKKSKSRNLLERLRDYENDTLRFMENALVPFSNNLGENDIRMTKVQQKISGCFRSMDGAKIFCLIRSFLSTSRKQGIKSSRALELLFNGKLPEFIE